MFRRLECFTAFPSQGYLHSLVQLVGEQGSVSCLGGVMMAKAVDEIDTMMDEVVFLTNLSC